MSQAAKWYVIHTYSGYENKVAQNIEKVVENRKLHDFIQEIRVPTERVTEIVDGKTKEVERKTFPGYVLVKMICTDDSWYVVRNTRGVTGFVGPGSDPTPLTEKEVAAMGVESGTTIVVDYAVGDRVSHVKFGEGTVSEMEDRDGSVYVTVEFDSVGRRVLSAAFARLKKL